MGARNAWITFALAPQNTAVSEEDLSFKLSAVITVSVKCILNRRLSSEQLQQFSLEKTLNSVHQLRIFTSKSNGCPARNN